jgi:CDGSH-type Zn-finger protein
LRINEEMNVAILIRTNILLKSMAKITIDATENGPYVIKVDGKTIAALCRCGASGDKPNCDGSHSKIGFKAKTSKLEV